MCHVHFGVIRALCRVYKAVSIVWYTENGLQPVLSALCSVYCPSYIIKNVVCRLQPVLSALCSVYCPLYIIKNVVCRLQPVWDVAVSNLDGVFREREVSKEKRALCSLPCAPCLVWCLLCCAMHTVCNLCRKMWFPFLKCVSI